jgi:hypothetical protein
VTRVTFPPSEVSITFWDVSTHESPLASVSANFIVRANHGHGAQIWPERRVITTTPAISATVVLVMGFLHVWARR